MNQSSYLPSSRPGALKKPDAPSSVRRSGAGQRSALSLVLMTVFAMIMLPTAGWGLEAGQTKTEHGLTVYIGLLPAEIVRGHPKSHPESSVHGGPPRGEHAYHVVAAIFDAASGARINDAKVAARVSGLGLAGQLRPLEPMSIADTITYGNYFSLPDKGRYRVDLEITRPQGVVRFVFDYQH